jgi:hypothetical protein
MKTTRTITTDRKEFIHELWEALRAYEHNFGAAPEWLEELSANRKYSLVRYALNRHIPLVAADVVN